MTSEPKRAISYLLVRLVAISTKQQERPKFMGQMDRLLPQETISSSLPIRKFGLNAPSGARFSGVSASGMSGLSSGLFFKTGSFF
jgi:hypothetical protein